MPNDSPFGKNSNDGSKYLPKKRVREKNECVSDDSETEQKKSAKVVEGANMTMKINGSSAPATNEAMMHAGGTSDELRGTSPPITIEKLLSVDRIATEILSYQPHRYWFVASVSKSFQLACKQFMKGGTKTLKSWAFENRLMMELCLNKRIFLPQEMCIMAARSDRLKDLELLVDQFGYLLDPIGCRQLQFRFAFGRHSDVSSHRTVLHMAATDNRECLEYLHGKGYSLGDGIFADCALVAAERGSLKCLMFCYEQGHGCNGTVEQCRLAARNGHLDCLMFALESGLRFTQDWGFFTDDNFICSEAAGNGHLACLQYAYMRGCYWDAHTCSQAVKCGSLACLKYAHEHDCPWDANECANVAAESGSLGCLEYLYNRGHGRDESVEHCRLAARHGHLDCLVFANEYGWGRVPEKDGSICSVAAGNGHLPCLKYAHKHGFHWDENTCFWAERNFHWDCLNYARENGCDYDPALKLGKWK